MLGRVWYNRMDLMKQVNGNLKWYRSWLCMRYVQLKSVGTTAVQHSSCRCVFDIGNTLADTCTEV
jgi:hypothetical protein